MERRTTTGSSGTEVSLTGFAGLDAVLAREDKSALEAAINACVKNVTNEVDVQIGQDISHPGGGPTIKLTVGGRAAEAGDIENVLISAVEAARNGRHEKIGHLSIRRTRRDDDGGGSLPPCEIDIST
jgi:hypothetical protein